MLSIQGGLGVLLSVHSLWPLYQYSVRIMRYVRINIVRIVNQTGVSCYLYCIDNEILVDYEESTVKSLDVLFKCAISFLTVKFHGTFLKLNWLVRCY